MDRLDTIIDALECARNEIHDPTLWTDKVDEALAAARELKALKPVVKVIAEDGGVYFELLDKKLLVGTKLYALDEVTK
jgi:hypothetical protein